MKWIVLWVKFRSPKSIVSLFLYRYSYCIISWGFAYSFCIGTNINRILEEREKEVFTFLTRGLGFSLVFFQVQCWQKQYRADLMFANEAGNPNIPHNSLCSLASFEYLVTKQKDKFIVEYSSYMAICIIIVIETNYIQVYKYSYFPHCFDKKWIWM